MGKGAGLSIGFINSTIREEWAEAQWQGFIRGAREKDVTSWSFIGGVLDAPAGFERFRNSVYALADKARLDGLVVWTGGINWYVSQPRMEEFLSGFGGLPIVCIEAAYPGFHSIVLDDYAGMKEGVDHLIEVHGRKKIAFIRGPAGHTGMQRRFEAYVASLKEHGLPMDPDLVTQPSGDLDGDRWLGELSTVSGAFDAVVGANDERSTEFMRRLQSATRLRVPRDVSVIGFDDAPCGRVSDPPLSSVSMPFAEIGARAVETISRILRGEEVQRTQTFVPKFRARQSCGCTIESIKNAADPSAFLRAAGHTGIAALIDECLHNAVDRSRAWAPHGEGADTTCGKSLVDALRTDMRSKASSRFLPSFEAAIATAPDLPADYLSFHDALTMLAAHFGSGIGSPWGKAKALRLIDTARIVLNELSVRKSGFALHALGSEEAMVRSVSQGLVANFDLDTMLTNIAKELPRMGIEKSYLLVYDRGRRDSATLIGGREARVGRPAPRVDPKTILPDEVVRSSGIDDYLALPLTFEDDVMGYLIFGAKPSLAARYESVAGQLGSALKGAMLVREVSAHDKAISEGVRGLIGTIEEMSRNIDAVSANMETQATSVEDEASAIEEMVRNVESVNQVSDRSRQFSNELNMYAGDSRIAITSMMDLIKDFMRKSQKINELMSLIKDVAEKIHILALNATIQAANAGAGGKVFAVVAAEIRKLSENTSRSIEDIEAQTKLIMDGIGVLSENASSLQGGISSLVSMAERNADVSFQLSTSISEQTTGAREMQVATTKLLQITEEVKAAIIAQRAATHEFYKSINVLQAPGTAAPTEPTVNLGGAPGAH